MPSPSLTHAFLGEDSRATTSRLSPVHSLPRARAEEDETGSPLTAEETSDLFAYLISSTFPFSPISSPSLFSQGTVF